MKPEQAVAEAAHLGFKPVYEGGHHVVFCNGSLHITSPKTQQSSVMFNTSRVTRCDCHWYKE